MINTVVLQGRLTDTPELRTTPSGTSVTTFSIAVARSYVKAGEERKTDFFDVVAWYKTAEFICKNFEKGQAIGITGHLQTDFYTDREGKNRKNIEVYCERADFLEKKSTPSPSVEYEDLYDNGEEFPF